jgi:toxin ParE1/3/4
MRIIWSPLAIDKVSEIAKYIAKDKSEAAEKWIDQIFNSVKKLENFPQIGRIVPEANRKEIREILLKNYRIIYRVEDVQLTILTVRHGKQILPVEDLKEK